MLFENDLELLLANTDFHPSRTQRSIHRMLLRRVDGMAFMGSEQEAANLDSLVQNRIPVVTTDHHRTAAGISDIVIDFHDGMAQLVGHLKELGHRNVGFIGGTEGLATSRDRRESFLDAVVKLGLSSREGWIVSGDYKLSGGTRGMEAILGHKEIPTAIVTANDLTAIGALRKAHERGLRIPEDLSVAGCDDIEVSDVVYPPLTTLRISRRQYAEILFDALQWGTEHPFEPGKVFSLPMQLIVRQSTGPVPRLSGSPLPPTAAKELPEDHVKNDKKADKAETPSQGRPADQLRLLTGPLPGNGGRCIRTMEPSDQERGSQGDDEAHDSAIEIGGHLAAVAQHVR